MAEQINVLDVADWFLDKEDISPKRLQKLVYYVQAWSYALFDRPFMYENGQPARFEAWRHGPVNPNLYNQYSVYGWQKIHSEVELVKEFNDEELDLLESVWETYSDYSPNEIENLTHREDPWINARNRAGVKDGEPSNELLTPDDMKAYYQSIYIGN